MTQTNLVIGYLATLLVASDLEAHVALPRGVVVRLAAARIQRSLTAGTS